MKTVAHPAVLESLVSRLRALEPGSARRWGTLTPHEMLCHLADSVDMVLKTRPRTRPATATRHPLAKLLWLWSPLHWPRGWPTNPQFNPRTEGTRPARFDADRDRVIAGLERLAAPSGELDRSHGMFGPMSVRDWQRWAWRHADHHLRQFGL
jgi:hypothetical protein